MPRCRQQSGLNQLFDLLKITPAWVGPVLAILLFLLLRFVAPLLLPVRKEFDFGAVIRHALPMLSWIGGGFVLAVWLIAEMHKLFNRRLLDGQTGIASIRDISWQDFERLVCEAYPPSLTAMQ